MANKIKTAAKSSSHVSTSTTKKQTDVTVKNVVKDTVAKVASVVKDVVHTANKIASKAAIPQEYQNFNNTSSTITHNKFVMSNLLKNTIQSAFINTTFGKTAVSMLGITNIINRYKSYDLSAIGGGNLDNTDTMTMQYYQGKPVSGFDFDIHTDPQKLNTRNLLELENFYLDIHNNDDNTKIDKTLVRQEIRLIENIIENRTIDETNKGLLACIDKKKENMKNHWTDQSVTEAVFEQDNKFQFEINLDSIFNKEGIGDSKSLFDGYMEQPPIDFTIFEGMGNDEMPDYLRPYNPEMMLPVDQLVYAGIKFSQIDGVIYTYWREVDYEKLGDVSKVYVPPEEWASIAVGATPVDAVKDFADLIAGKDTFTGEETNRWLLAATIITPELVDQAIKQGAKNLMKFLHLLRKLQGQLNSLNLI